MEEYGLDPRDIILNDEPEAPKLDLKIKPAKDPIWKRDGHLTEEAYEEHMVRLVDDLLDESERAWKMTKQRWMHADKRLELDLIFDILQSSTAIKSDLPLVPQAIEEKIAVQVESLPRPSIVARQETQEQFVGALNQFVGEELDSNDFDILMMKIALDMARFNLGIIKQSVDPYGTGPFGQKGKILLKRVDPRHINPDPLSTTFEGCRYIIEARPMDLSDIRELFPLRGQEVGSEAAFTLNRRGETRADEIEVSQGSSGSVHTIGERQRALVKEMWIRDDRKEFIPELDEDGNEILDSDGKAVGRVQKIYPHGRLVITANKVLLLDIANPFRHGQFPYTFFPGRVSARLLSYGDVEVLARIEDKINQLHKDMIKNARVNMNSPWIVDSHAFDSPSKMHNITNVPGLVLPVRPGAKVYRLPPAELPQFIFPMLNWLKGIFDDVLGIQSISRGQLEKGAQLSAEAIQSLQGTATSRIRLKSRLLENSLKHLGHLLQWNIRQFYPAGLQTEMADPSNPGKKVALTWSDAAAQSDYAVAVQAGSSLPGSKQSMSAMALALWNAGLLGPRTTLKMMEFPGADAAVEERKQMLEALAAANLKAAVKEATGASNQSNKPGRESNKLVG